MGFALASDLIASSDSPVIVGLGDTGLSCARFYARRGIPCAIVDSRPQPPGLESLHNEMPDVETCLGEIPPERLSRAGRLVVSPGVPLDHPAVAAAIDAGVPVCGDIDLFVQEATAPVVGITGSNGKSTVTALLGRMAERSGRRVAVGGNLGPPALDLLDDSVELYVIELSSFQLERAGPLKLAAACVLNLSPDHMDRHGSMPRYHQAKHRVFPGCESIVFNRDDTLTRPLQAGTVPTLSFGLGEPDLKDFGLRSADGELYLCRGFEPLMPAGEVRMLGRHNLANALASLALGSQLGLSMPAMLDELRNFPGLDHRCQHVATVDGVHYVNDSKATNPGATRAALSGMEGAAGIVLLAGGQAKGANFAELADDIAARCRAVVLLGEATELLAAALEDRLPLQRADSMQAAVESAAAAAQAGDTVMLSPACASFDMFDGYAARGASFVDAVNALRERGGAA